MRKSSQVEVITLIVLSCYDVIAGKLPKGMFEHVSHRLAVREWDDMEAFQRAAKLAAEEFLAEMGGEEVGGLWSREDSGNAN